MLPAVVGPGAADHAHEGGHSAQAARHPVAGVGDQGQPNAGGAAPPCQARWVGTNQRLADAAAVDDMQALGMRWDGCSYFRATCSARARLLVLSEHSGVLHDRLQQDPCRTRVRDSCLLGQHEDTDRRSAGCLVMKPSGRTTVATDEMQLNPSPASTTGAEGQAAHGVPLQHDGAHWCRVVLCRPHAAPRLARLLRAHGQGTDAMYL